VLYFILSHSSNPLQRWTDQEWPSADDERNKYADGPHARRGPVDPPEEIFAISPFFLFSLCLLLIFSGQFFHQLSVSLIGAPCMVFSRAVARGISAVIANWIEIAFVVAHRSFFFFIFFLFIFSPEDGKMVDSGEVLIEWPL
jgi:hypothetical protein